MIVVSEAHVGDLVPPSPSVQQKLSTPPIDWRMLQEYTDDGGTRPMGRLTPSEFPAQSSASSCVQPGQSQGSMTGVADED
jgi:hypothetical protein